MMQASGIPFSRLIGLNLNVPEQREIMNATLLQARDAIIDQGYSLEEAKRLVWLMIDRLGGLGGDG